MKKVNFGAMLNATVKTQDKAIADKFENADKEFARIAANPGQLPVPDRTPQTKNLAVRHSFSMPASDYTLLESIRKKANSEDRITSISEVIRAGVHALSAYGGPELIVAIDNLEHLRPGRKS